MNHEYIKMIIACVIAATVLIGGIMASKRRDPHEKTVIAEDLDIEETDPAESTLTTSGSSDEIVHIDLFADISVYAAGIYPDIENIAITASPEDSVARKVTYSFSSDDQFSPDGAEIMIEVDTSEIDDYLTMRNFVPTSRSMTYTINPLTMVSYLVQQGQFTTEVRESCIRSAAEAVTSSIDAAPVQLILILPQHDAVFHPKENIYAGLYGLACFFEQDGGIQCGFACPSINPDGSIYEIHTAVSDRYLNSERAYAALIMPRLENENIMTVTVPVPRVVKEND